MKKKMLSKNSLLWVILILERFSSLCQDFRIGTPRKYSAHVYIVIVSRQLVLLSLSTVHQQVDERKEGFCVYMVSGQV